MTLNVLSLFAGIGGIELGLERAGMTTVGQVEIDSWARSVLAKHWPGVPQHDDVITAPEWWDSTERPPVDLVCGGFPCQPFSLAGKQLGIDDVRWLWPATAAVIRAVRPRYALLENVSALVRDSWAFNNVLADLHALGFDAEWATLRASDFGAPHNRERVYIVAYPKGSDGWTWPDVEQGRARRASLTARGLLGPDASERRRAASAWLEREPRVARLVDGFPGRMDRIKGLGNAVVPQVLESIGRQILEHHEASLISHSLTTTNPETKD